MWHEGVGEKSVGYFEQERGVKYEAVAVANSWKMLAVFHLPPSLSTLACHCHCLFFSPPVAPPLEAAMSRAVFLFIRRFCVLLALFSTWPRTFHSITHRNQPETPSPRPLLTTLLFSYYHGTTFRDPFYFVCPFWTLASSTRVHFQLSVLPVAFPCCCCYSCCIVIVVVVVDDIVDLHLQQLLFLPHCHAYALSAAPRPPLYSLL